MSGRTVAIATVLALLAGLTLVAVRSDGYPGKVLQIFAGTHWLVDNERGHVVLADAASGRAIAGIIAEEGASDLRVVQGAGGAFLLNLAANTARFIDERGVQLNDTRNLDQLANAQDWTFTSAPDGLVAAAGDGSALALPMTGGLTSFTVGASAQHVFDASGGLWSLLDSGFIEHVVNGGEPTTIALDYSRDGARLATSGDLAYLIDVAGHRVIRLDTEEIVELPTGLDLTDPVIQEPSADGSCLWLGGGSQLACVGSDGSVSSLQLQSFTLEANDRLLVTKGVLALLRPQTGAVVIIDQLTGAVRRVTVATLGASSRLVAQADAVSIWIDDPDGGGALAISAEGERAINKNDDVQFFAADGTLVSRSDVASDGDNGSGGNGTFDAVPHPTKPDDNGQDDPPIAVDDVVTARQDLAVSIAVATNDYDPDGLPVALSFASQPKHGTTTMLDANTIVYEPEPGYVGLDEFTYRVTDTMGHEDTAKVTVTLFRDADPNRSPIAMDDTVVTAAGRDVSIDVLANDVDPEHGSMTPLITPGSVSGGTATIVPSGAGRPVIRFTPAPATTDGVLTFSYLAVDSEEAPSKTATVRVRIVPDDQSNGDPTPLPDAAIVRAGGSVVIPVLANDLDPDADTLGIKNHSLSQQAASASIVDDTIVVTTSATAARLVSFDYTVSDPEGKTGVAKVLVLVLPPDGDNRRPMANPDTVVIGDRSLVFDPTLNDVDPDGDALVISNVTILSPRAPKASATQTDKRSILIAPDASSRDTVTIGYTVTDGQFTSTSTVTAWVRGARLSGGPSPEDDHVTARPGETIEIPVLENDRDPNGDPLRIASVDRCTCRVNPNGTIAFVAPNVVETTQYEFSYRVANSVNDSAEARVLVTVQPDDLDNARPIANSDSFDVIAGTPKDVDVRKNDTDEEDPVSTLEIAAVGPTSAAGVTQLAEGMLRITVPPDTAETSFRFTYTIVDPDGAESAPGTVNVRVLQPAERPITLQPDAATITDVTSIDVLANDVGSDGSSASLDLDSVDVRTGKDLVSASVSGRQVLVTPVPGKAGTATITYLATDDGGASAQSELQVTVEVQASPPPKAADDSFDVMEGVSKDLAVRNNDFNPGLIGALALSIERQPAKGSASVVGDIVRYAAKKGSTGTDSFTYVLTDERGQQSVAATVNLRIAPCSNTLPSTDIPAQFTKFNTDLPITLFGPGNSNLTVTFEDVRNGTVRQGGSAGVAIFSPTPGTNDFGSFRYVVSNECSSATGHVDIDVNRFPTVSSVEVVAAPGSENRVSVSTFAADDEPVTVANATAAGLSVGHDSTEITFTAPTTPGKYAISVTVADPGGLTASGVITLRVVPTSNAVPTASNDMYFVPPGEATIIPVLTNDSDPDGPGDLERASLDSTSFVVDGVAVPISVAPDGQGIVVAPPAGTHGTGTFRYRALDTTGAPSNRATVTIIVDRAPEARTFAVTRHAGISEFFSEVTAGTPDPDGDPVTLQIRTVSDPAADARETFGQLFVTLPADLPSQTLLITFDLVDRFGLKRAGSLTITVIGGAPATTTTTTTVPPPTDPPVTEPPTTTTAPEPPPTTTAPPATG